MDVVDPIDQYISTVPLDRQEYIANIRNIIKTTLVPLGYKECINYGMIGYVIPRSLYPDGYHVDPTLPLPFVALASQKHSINLYHLGIYADPALLQWWQNAYTKENIGKLDMGKFCIRFKNMKKIPYSLIEELMKKMPATAWIALYKQSLKPL